MNQATPHAYISCTVGPIPLMVHTLQGLRAHPTVTVRGMLDTGSSYVLLPLCWFTIASTHDSPWFGLIQWSDGELFAVEVDIGEGSCMPFPVIGVVRLNVDGIPVGNSLTYGEWGGVTHS